MDSSTKIHCPKCGFEIDVNTLLVNEIEEKFRQKFNYQLAEEKEKYNNEVAAIQEQKVLLEQAKTEQDRLVSEKVNSLLNKEKDNLEKKIKAAITEEQSGRISTLENEIKEKSKQVKELNRSKAEIEKLKREKDELKEKIEADSLKVLNEQISLEKEKIRKTEQEKNELVVRELQKQLEDQKKLTDEMKRKQDQGSMQMQGEVQELALEELLKASYPFDRIQEVSKGVRGADSIQTVINSLQQDCGLIVYESKRTKNFSNDWIEKLKQDQATCKADIAVLVTEVFPSGMDRFGEKDGIWICGFHEVKSLSFVLREMLIKTHSVKLAQENKGDKMELLYIYLTSNEFVQKIKLIVENYDAMVNQLNSEKKAIQKIWAIREKQIWVVQENISALFGSIKGIAGNALQTVNALELSVDNSIQE